MEEQIEKYIRENYSVNKNRQIQCKDGNFEYGHNICTQLETIFSVDYEIITKIAKSWFIENIGDDIVNLHWFKPKYQTHFEFKSNQRFILRFPEEFGLNEFMVKSTSRPKMSMMENGYPIRRLEWEDIEIIFHDLITPSTSQRMIEIIENQRHNFTYSLQMLGPVGDVVEQWDIIGFISSIDFGVLDYSSNNLAEIKMTFKPNQCVLVF